MSVGGQFKRIGEIGVALALWRLVFWIFSSPKRFFISGGIFIALVGLMSNLVDNTNKKHYVHANDLALLNKPFGDTINVLHMNDSLVVLKEMGDKWMMVLVENDTMYFNNGKSLDLSADKIATSPFTIEEALEGVVAKLNHPDGFFDVYPEMLKNGEEVTIAAYSKDTKKVNLKSRYGRSDSLPIEYLIIDWEALKEKYPHLDLHSDGI